MKKIVALIVLASFMYVAEAQTSGQRSTPYKLESNNTKPSSSSTNKSNDSLKVGDGTKPTNSGKPVDVSKDQTKQEGAGKQRHENGSYHSNERSKVKSNNGNHYGQLKDKKKN